MSRSFAEAVQAATERLAACGIVHMLTGGIAVQAWGAPRLTFDADIEASFRDPQQLACFERGLLLQEEGRDILGQATRIYNVPINPVDIEVFVATHPFVLRAMQRRRQVPVPGILKEPAWLIAPEDLIVMKALHAAHPSRPRFKAAQDRVDIAAMLAAQAGRLDLALMQKEATSLGIQGEPAAWTS